jgi:uncharacterized small protein (DUF1192 family)
MPTHGAALGPDVQTVQWRVAQEAQSMRDMLTVYRTGASALAERVSELRDEVARLRDALRADRAGRGIATVEVNFELDEYAPGLARAMLRVECADTRLRLEVENRGARDPVACAWHADGFAESIVERLSERWGMELTSAGRYTVWAVLVAGAPLG